MKGSHVDPALLDGQEDLFARAYAAGDIRLARDAYQPDVAYLSPTVRLFDWPRRIEGLEPTLEFIQLTIRECPNIGYEAVERACLPDGRSAFVRVHFDWDHGRFRLRSSYVVLYRYRDRRIAQQELYYDPGSPPERLSGRPLGF